ncbi:MAG: hypothetical protein JEY91_16360 [Spirochaetaceae bacterium]|nr:hypothetical protein [Spirochaetaceae bacterium]
MFSVMEKNRKTYQLVQKYIDHLSENNCSCTNLDNHIEMDEIKKWLKEISADDHDNAAIAEWIKNNGKSFRTYLNTVKLIYMIWFCTTDRRETISWEDFCSIGDNLNNIKNTCLDSIY